MDHLLWTERAWVGGRWLDSVLLEIDKEGCWGAIRGGVAVPPVSARRLSGPLLPGLVNAHSHAFQRAFVGLAERRDSASDDFWSWRQRMYLVALRITPEQMQAVAAQLYVELLRGGYTQVCEFHYLHHDPTGRAYPEPSTMCWALADAAQTAGMGLTLLPVLYERAGFSQPALHPDQRRFATTPALVEELYRTIQTANRPLLDAGVAIHSLRAASKESIATLLNAMDDEPVPIHIHVAEQTREVEECIDTHGARPIEWLCREHHPDARWQLVHATHATAAEIGAVAKSEAGIVICPSTEGNLGDGLSDLGAWLDADVPISIGSDSHVCRNWPEELRWLEYGQRLQRHQRNVAAAPAKGVNATAARLFDTALSASGGCAGHERWGLLTGARADALVLDTQAPALLGIPSVNCLDALVFGGGEPALSEVLVAGKTVMINGRHARQKVIEDDFRKTMESLWRDAMP